MHTASCPYGCYQENADNVDKFIELVHRYTDFTELTTPMINEFVDKIVVHEADKSTGDRIQQIDIYLKYVGRLDVPMPELTPEQIKKKTANALSVHGTVLICVANMSVRKQNVKQKKKGYLRQSDRLSQK